MKLSGLSTPALVVDVNMRKVNAAAIDDSGGQQSGIAASEAYFQLTIGRQEELEKQENPVWQQLFGCIYFVQMVY